jgi:hypothetical protein
LYRFAFEAVSGCDLFDATDNSLSYHWFSWWLQRSLVHSLVCVIGFLLSLGPKNIDGFIRIPTSLRFLQSELGVWPSFSANRLQSMQLDLILDSTVVDEGFFLLVFLKGVRNSVEKGGYTEAG